MADPRAPDPSGPLVSIVLPVHDGERHLAAAIDSCLASEGVRLEVVAVDDASKDASPRILAEAARRDPRVRVLTSARNLRLPGALNLGFREARGDLLTWTSDDNLFRPEALRVLSEALRDAPEAGVAYADYTRIDESGAVLGSSAAGDSRHLGYSNGIGPCFLYRRSLADAVGPYADDLFLAEDYDFWLRAAARAPFVHVAKDLYLYRQHPASLTARNPDAVPRAVRAVLERNLPTMPKPLRLGAHQRIEDVARATGDRSGARAAWRAQFREDPVAALRRLARRWTGRG